jgi:hypothetical protein
MKTRIVWTKIWDDEWFDNLSQEARWLFIYLLTNQDIGLSGCFYITDKKISFHTHISIKKLIKAKKELEPKVLFKDSWIYITNAQGYNGFTGIKIETAVEREIELIPQNIKNTLSIVKPYRVSEKSDRVSGVVDTPIIINNKSEIRNTKSYEGLKDKVNSLRSK